MNTLDLLANRFPTFLRAHKPVSRQNRQSRLGTAFLALAFWSFAASHLPASEVPRVWFDVPSLVACRDVTDEEFAAMHPGHRLVEAVLPVSSLIRDGQESDLREFFYGLHSPQHTLRVVDFDPKTTMTSDVAGPISVEKREERLRGFGLTLSGQYDKTAKASGSGDVSNKTSEARTYERLPEKQLLLASGTLARGHGAYFKFKPSRTSSLEGEKHLRIVFHVPLDWRADYVRVDCEARGTKRGLVRWLDEPVVSGKQSFLVALYLAGDESAHHAARNFDAAQRALKQVAAINQSAIARRNYPTLLHRVGAALDLVDPQIAPDWLVAILLGHPDSAHGALPHRLPVDVRAAALHYADAKRSLMQMAATPTPVSLTAEPVRQKGKRERTNEEKPSALWRWPPPLRHLSPYGPA